jgi:hypothetical protein
MWNTCVGTVVPMTIYGDPAGTAGYLYTNDYTNALTNMFATTALDVTWEGDTVSFYALEWTCEVTS